jgi:hypothetical protein
MIGDDQIEASQPHRPRVYDDVVVEMSHLDRVADAFEVSLRSSALGESAVLASRYAIGELAPGLWQMDRGSIGESDLIELGAGLADRLFPEGEVRDLARLALRHDADRRVRIRLVVRDQALAQQPWEYCYLARLLFPGAS